MNVYALAELVRVRERERERVRRGFVLFKNATKCHVATLFHPLVAANVWLLRNGGLNHKRTNGSGRPQVME